MGPGAPRRLFVYNGGFLGQGPSAARIRRILSGAGYEVRLGRPSRPEDLVGVWGQSPTAPRGAAVAGWTGAGVLRVEDAFLRSVRPGRQGGEPPIGLLLDRTGLHFDPSGPSDLETLLSTHPLDDPALLARARAGIALLRRLRLSKYNAWDPGLTPPAPGHVLVIDQTRGDASVRASGADAATFRTMLTEARAEFPDHPILVRTHPETAAGTRAGHLGEGDLLDGDMRLCTEAINPWDLQSGAVAVYAVSSQLGFEAILAGHRPRLYGQPFHAGWGLSEDRAGAPARRGRPLTAEQLFAATMLLFPQWHDPHRDVPCDFETAALALQAEARAWAEDHRGWIATGMRLWKRKPLQDVFGRVGPAVQFARPPQAIARAKAERRRLMAWAGPVVLAADPPRQREAAALRAAGVVLVEDGFLRSRGLGADLIPPLSLICDDLGIYYDPTRESRMEREIARAAADLTPEEAARARAVLARLTGAGLTKYNLTGQPLPGGLPAGRRILVPGQVEDDASIRLGAPGVRRNRDLLAAARAAHPAAVLLYKPHPDVEAGLRPGAVPDAGDLADAVLSGVSAGAALGVADQVWTMTSTLGFEALLRGIPVTCLGQPFYAGWGLTEDLGPPLPRRLALPRPDLIALVHATLIAVPRYHDPVSGRPCPIEVALDRLATGDIPAPSRLNRLLAKAQGALAGSAWIWRR